MRKTTWILLMLLVIPGLLFTVSCAKKTVRTSETAVQQAQQDEEALIRARQVEAKKKAEEEEAARRAALQREQLEREKAEKQRLAMQKQLQEQELRRQEMAARQMFESEDIYFEFDSSALLAAAQQVLKRKAEWLRANPDAKIIIEGHCDERGTNEYNLALGERRAESAKTFLVDLGISASRIRTISYGEERPVDPGHNEEAWAKNRRAHFVLE